MAKQKMNPAMNKQPKKHVLGRLLKYLFHYHKASLIVVMICIVLSAVAGISSSVFLQTIIDNCITPGLTTGWDAVYKKLITLILTLVSIYLLGLLSSFTFTRIMAVVTQKFMHNLRTEMFCHMQKLPIKYFDNNTHGDIMSYYTNDIDAIRQLVSSSLPQLLTSVLTVSGLFVVMLTFSVYLTLLVIVGVVFMSLVTKKIGGGSAKYFIRQQKSLAKTEGFIEEMMHGQKVVKVFCHEDETITDFNKINDELYEDAKKANTYANILMPIMFNIGNIMYVLLAFVGSILFFNNVPNLTITGMNVLEIGVVVSFLAMSKNFSSSIGQASQHVNSIVMALAGANRIFELLDQPVEQDNGYVTLVNAKYDEQGNLTETEERTGIWAWKHPHQADGTVTYQLLEGDIRMFEVDFGYVPDKIVLHDVTLYAKPGQKVAFVGSTGAGKTTITNLINRFYDIADGKIRYDGININKIKKSDLRRSLGMVLQDTNLFTGTVMENIRYGRLDATDEECIEAAKLANAHDFITRLNDGYNTMLTSDGANLSQGQRQLLSIARAAVANAPVMILDEATSSIDTRTEALVQKGTDSLMKGRTVFVIAHRLSTVQNSDVIMVLEQGRIIERGTHDDLIDKKGKYYQLYTGAFELE